MFVPSKPPDGLRIFAFSDWRVQPLDYLFQILSEYITDADVIVYAGDDLDRFDGHPLVHPIARLACSCRSGRFLFVGGNDDEPAQVLAFSRLPASHNLHEAPFYFGSFAFFGVEGSSDGIGPLQHSEAEIEQRLSSYRMTTATRSGDYLPVLVSHAPPYGILDIAVRFSPEGAHIGRESLRAFLDANRVPLTICGHVHLCGGRSEVLGNGNIVLNIGSHDDEGAEGRIAVVDLLPDGKAIIHQLTTRMLDRLHELTRLVQVGPRRVHHFMERNIMGIADVSEETRDVLLTIPGAGDWHVERWIRQAKLLRAKRSEFEIVDREKMSFLTRDHFVVWDIETNLSVEQRVIWLIGAHDTSTNETVQFFQPDDERKCIEDFLTWISHRPNATPVSYSTSGFDTTALATSMRRHNLVDGTQFVERDIDLGDRVLYRCVSRYNDFSLKGLARDLGFRFRHPDIDGEDVGMMFTEYQLTRKAPDWRKLLEYNADDVGATVHLLGFLCGSYERQFGSYERHSTPK